ncbi:ca[2+] channel Muscle-specific alpha2/delta subunit [Haematobia irritans]|uniref:ca[2+] channel Muscle-specific alpha2/delta subunit n=1 Tax=Haematobia irritans TaxID=7368 RepID=UPI003F4F9A76
MYCSCDKLMTHISLVLTAFLLFYFICLPPSLNQVEASAEDEAVAKWASQIGDELWELAQIMTKSKEIKAKYKEYNARVEFKNGTELIQSITENVGRMLARKMDAVRCIMEVAEREYENFVFNETEAENFTYYSSKFSKFNDNSSEELIGNLKEENANMYKDFELNPDTHFYNISVDTEHSAVHVPSNVYDKHRPVLETIMWTESLDAIFRQNYKSDPALSWQYFGSDTGILRHFPAIQWDKSSEDENADIYDCRKRSWYIETATCSKDIVILLDNSGSMVGFPQHVAKFTIRSILDTFSNNDFFTIFNYSATVDDVIPCFKDALVQATPENIRVFNHAISKLKPTGYANLTIAYTKAFELLKEYYLKRDCNTTRKCNQAIMVVTDGVAGNTTEVFETYNWGDGENGTMSMNVRIFTYLLGKEVTKVREIQWMACLNRGYYSHVQTLDEVQEEALKYVDVIATPLVLQDIEHPPTWTHAFTDKTYKPEGNSTNARLMIAVGVPAFDRSYNKPNSTKHARLLGVAGTDVPVEDIDKLTLPYKLGVNGYSFVVSNNGYVLLHPDLRAIGYNGVMNPNYNSIDFTEVEQLSEDDEPRRPGNLILNLRERLVHNETGELVGVSVKLHYDKMRRVVDQQQDYFFAPLPGTPFSLGIVLPSTYGKTWIKVGDEVLKNIHMKVNISDFFVGDNWKVHPDWVYCKYHYLEGHEFKTPEDEVRHFLKKMVQPDWGWYEQYENDLGDGTSESNCSRTNLDEDAYYCNKELVQLLIFDAKVTYSSYGVWKFKNDEEKALIERFGASQRFVATMSGLTRWQFIYAEDEGYNEREFGDYHTKAIDETWYRSAILQHHSELTETFVYSVKHSADPNEHKSPQVTASHAIFPRDGGKEAPACVVGFQFSYALMYERFYNITSNDNCNGCIKTCNSDEKECYVIDNNAYIILAHNPNHTGIFFGEYHAEIMKAMVDAHYFKEIIVYDYQSLCPNGTDKHSDANIMLHPVQFFNMAWKWLVTKIFWHYSRIQWWVQGAPYLDYDENSEEDYSNINEPYLPDKPKGDADGDEKEHIFHEPPPEPVYVPCDKIATLYTLDPVEVQKERDFTHLPNSRPFHVKKIPNSNLLLIVIDVLKPSKGTINLSVEPKPVEYDNEFPCYKLNMSFYKRRRIEECFTEDEREEQFTYCGDATSISFNTIVMGITLFVVIIAGFLQS